MGGGALGGKGRELRKNLTDAEKRLWRHIRNRQLLGCKFRRQAPIGKYIVDFVCFEKRVIIELDGGQHALRQEDDHHRTAWLESQGFTVIRFWNHDVLREVEAVKEVIVRSLEFPPSWPSPTRADRNERSPHQGFPPQR